MDSCFKFLHKSILLNPKEHIILKPKQQKLLKVEAPIHEEFLGFVIIKLLDQSAQTKVTVKVKFQRNILVLDITDHCLNTVIFTAKKHLGVEDL